MIDLILLSRALIFSSLLMLLSIGLTLTYLTTKVPNFAHGTFAAVGAYVTLTAVTLWRGNVYHFLFLALLVGGIIAIALYFIVFRPLMRRGATVIGLMITTLAIEFILLGVLNIYADYLTKLFVRADVKIDSRYFLLQAFDIDIVGQRGLLIVAPTLAIVSVTLLYLALTRTKFGVAMRAAIEDSSLASVVGINVNLVYAVSWFVAGGLAGLSGALLPLWMPGNPDMGSTMIVSVFAASIIGGLGSIYGAVLGGFLIGFAEILVTRELVVELGVGVRPYRPLIPLIAIAITLLLASEGLLGINWRGTAKGVWDKVVGFVLIPSETFDGVKDENRKSSVKHYSKLLAIFATLQTVVFTAMYTVVTLLLSYSHYRYYYYSIVTTFFPMHPFVHWPLLLRFASIFLWGLIVILVGSLLMHIWVYIFGGRKGVGQTIKSVAYGSTPFFLLGWMPFVGIVFAIWSMVASIMGIRQLHEISTRKAVAAFILGALTLSIILIPFFALLFS